MKHMFLSLLTLAALASCTSGESTGSGGIYTGGGTPSSPAPAYLTHAEAAQLFVQDLNLDPEFNVTLSKSDTLQYDFIVIYDPYTDSYDALNIDSYDPNYDNAADYYFNNSARGYFNLEINPGYYDTEYEYTVIGYDVYGDSIWGYEAYDVWVPTTFYDYSSGLTFEKVNASTKDLAKITALKEAASVKKSAEFISSEFGLSLERAKEIAGLKAHWKKAGVKGMTANEVDRFSTELLGFSLTKGIEAFKSSTEGNSSSLDGLVKEAAAVNGITPEHAEKLMTKVFGL